MTGPMLDADLERQDGRVYGPGRSAPIPAQRTPEQQDGSAARILVVDPEHITREALRHALRGIGITDVTGAGTAREVETIIDRTPAGDLVLISTLFGRQSPGIIRSLRSAGWPRIMSVSPVAEIGPVMEAVSAGVTGIIVGRQAPAATRNVPNAIHELSSREIEVIKMVAEGRSNKWIGTALDLSALTVKSHLARIGRKLGTGDRAHMVALAMRAGVIS